MQGGIRTRGTSINSYDGLANRCLQPLGHLSIEVRVVYTDDSVNARGNIQETWHYGVETLDFEDLRRDLWGVNIFLRMVINVDGSK